MQTENLGNGKRANMNGYSIIALLLDSFIISFLSGMDYMIAANSTPSSQ